MKTIEEKIEEAAIKNGDQPILINGVEVYFDVTRTFKKGASFAKNLYREEGFREAMEFTLNVVGNWEAAESLRKEGIRLGILPGGEGEGE